MYIVIAGALLAVVLATPVHAQIHVDIGIHLPAPPPLVVVPGIPSVQYVPEAPVNVFFYGNQYWIFANGGWHVSRRHDGPWILVEPQFVPRPVLLVPVRYYHVPPGHWQQWEDARPPRWQKEWGREWSEKREWRGREHEREHEREGRRGRRDGRD